MGPSHPSTHGVLRHRARTGRRESSTRWPDVGYLHRGDEKIAENMTYTQFIPYTDRLDYLAPLANNVAYALAVEKLLRHRQLPPRCQYIRVICANWRAFRSHLLGVGCCAMDVGAMTVFLLHVHRAREDLQSVRVAQRRAVHHQLHAHRRVSRDMPPGFVPMLRKFLEGSRRQHRRGRERC